MVDWISKVPDWVLPLVEGYVIPDDAQVQTGVDFDDLTAGDGDSVSINQDFTLAYPGFIPAYALEPIIQPTTDGVNYILKAKKGVGFYGCRTSVISYDDKKINRWEFPVERKQFGWLALARDEEVLSDNRISYAQEIHVCIPSILLLLNYDDQFDQENLFNSADKFTATHIHARLSPTVKIRFTPLPTWEVWALRFFQEDGTA